MIYSSLNNANIICLVIWYYTSNCGIGIILHTYFVHVLGFVVLTSSYRNNNWQINNNKTGAYMII